MHFLTVISSLLGLLTLVVGANPIVTDGSAVGPASAASLDLNGLPYKTEVFQYDGKIAGFDVQLNGTVQEIFTQMETLHPDANVISSLGSQDAFNSSIASDSETKLNARNKNGLLCCPVRGQSWALAQNRYIEDGIRYLNGLGRCPVNGRTCVRISCSWSSAIFLCNDNSYRIEPACNYLATYAGDILRSCAKSSGFTPNSMCGQEFDSDRYNVIVRGTAC